MHQSEDRSGCPWKLPSWDGKTPGYDQIPLGYKDQHTSGYYKYFEEGIWPSVVFFMDVLEIHLEFPVWNLEFGMA